MIQSSSRCSIPGAVVCKIGHNLDFRSAARFREQSANLAKIGYVHFVLDLSGTEVLDSTGLGAVISLQRRIKPSGGNVLFAAASRSVVTLLELTKCNLVFGNHQNVEEALHTLKSANASQKA
jgi:anti-sigma B factor antagonist